MPGHLTIVHSPHTHPASMVPRLGMLEVTSSTTPFNKCLQPVVPLFVQSVSEMLILPASYGKKSSTNLCVKKYVLNQIHTGLTEYPSPLLLQDLGINSSMCTLSTTFLSL